MSATPETDAKVSGHIGFYSCATVPAELCRRMERERDEAREQRDSLQALSQSLAETCTKLKTERDEARGDLENMQCQRDLAMKLIKRLEQERDEARTELERHGWRLTS
jgi:chromosome segregation ATPase